MPLHGVSSHDTKVLHLHHPNGTPFHVASARPIPCGGFVSASSFPTASASSFPTASAQTVSHTPYFHQPLLASYDTASAHPVYAHATHAHATHFTGSSVCVPPASTAAPVPAFMECSGAPRMSAADFCFPHPGTADNASGPCLGDAQAPGHVSSCRLHHQQSRLQQQPAQPSPVRSSRLPSNTGLGTPTCSAAAPLGAARSAQTAWLQTGWTGVVDGLSDSNPCAHTVRPSAPARQQPPTCAARLLSRVTSGDAIS